MPPGLALSQRPTHRILSYAALSSRRSYSVSPTAVPQNLQPRVQLALRSPFTLTSHTAIPPPAALFHERNKDYLLSLNGFLHYSPAPVDCQQIQPAEICFFVNPHNAHCFSVVFSSFFGLKRAGFQQKSCTESI